MPYCYNKDLLVATRFLPRECASLINYRYVLIFSLNFVLICDEAWLHIKEGNMNLEERMPIGRQDFARCFRLWTPTANQRNNLEEAKPIKVLASTVPPSAFHCHITMTSPCASCRLRSPATQHFFNCLLRLTSKKTSKPALQALWESIRQIALTKGQWEEREYHDVIMQMLKHLHVQWPSSVPVTTESGSSNVTKYI